jgi:hypothetical protein
MHGRLRSGKTPPHSLVERTPESRFPTEAKSKVGSHCFSSLFRKQLRLFNETSGVNLAYIYDAIIPSKHKRLSDGLSSLSSRHSIGREDEIVPVREPLAVLDRQVQADAHFRFVPAAAFSLQSVAKGFCRLPCLFIADMGVADRGADILVAEELLDLAKILSHMVEQDCGRGMPQPCAVISPTPSARQAARSRRLNARLENGAPEYPANTNSDPAKTIPPEARILLPLKLSWMAFHSRSAALKAPVTGTSWKTLPLPLIRSATISFPTAWQSSHLS